MPSPNLLGRRRFREYGPDDADTLLFFDSQGNKVIDRPKDYDLPNKCKVIAIPGGGLQEVLEYSSRPTFTNAKTIILGGIGTNDLSRRGPPRPAPPTVVAAGPHPSITFSDRPSTDNQYHGLSDRQMITLYEKVVKAVRGDQLLITTDPIPRRSSGFINKKIEMLQKKIPRGTKHHHLTCLNALTCKNRFKKKGNRDSVYGGRRPIRSTCFESDGVHLKAESLKNFLRAITRMVHVTTIVDAGQSPPKPGTWVMDKGGYSWGF